jgi:hypothetical protein
VHDSVDARQGDAGAQLPDGAAASRLPRSAACLPLEQAVVHGAQAGVRKHLGQQACGASTRKIPHKFAPGTQRQEGRAGRGGAEG